MDERTSVARVELLGETRGRVRWGDRPISGRQPQACRLIASRGPTVSIALTADIIEVLRLAKVIFQLRMTVQPRLTCLAILGDVCLLPSRESKPQEPLKKRRSEQPPVVRM